MSVERQWDLQEVCTVCKRIWIGVGGGWSPLVFPHYLLVLCFLICSRNVGVCSTVTVFDKMLSNRHTSAKCCNPMCQTEEMTDDRLMVVRWCNGNRTSISQYLIEVQVFATVALKDQYTAQLLNYDTTEELAEDEHFSLKLLDFIDNKSLLTSQGHRSFLIFCLCCDLSSSDSARLASDFILF